MVIDRKMREKKIKKNRGEREKKQNTIGQTNETKPNYYQ